MKPQNNTALIEIKLKETTMLALEILDYFRSEQIAYGCTPFLLEMYNEAIAELEALQQHKSCEGCKY